ncbi:hypothetical protein LWI28_001469 [Acer negundo]|uniref:Uncharacterized protein n=1 Tax=Acer negundo TaxID=4023 RepID=A0AAD5J2B4_ACENE|nr:hypothetical protein LWI28_001469 [Acer negundo]
MQHAAFERYGRVLNLPSQPQRQALVAHSMIPTGSSPIIPHPPSLAISTRLQLRVDRATDAGTSGDGKPEDIAVATTESAEGGVVPTTPRMLGVGEVPAEAVIKATEDTSVADQSLVVGEKQGGRDT